MAATANLSSKITLDDSQFVSGMRRVRNSARIGLASVSRAAEKAKDGFQRVGRSLAGISMKLAKIGAVAGTITFAGAVAGTAAFARGLKGAIDTGSKLSDLSARTDIAVGKIAVLGEAFRISGIEADKVGDVINDMQEKIVEAGEGSGDAAEGLKLIGLRAEELINLKPSAQFERIAKAISNIENPAVRSAAAMKIFGGSGAELLTMFNDPTTLDRASQALGTQAKLLEKNAETFDRISDLLGGAATKLQGFFVGVADVFAPDILKKLESINSIDFAAFGQNLAKSVKDGNIIDILSKGLTWAVTAFGNGLIKAVTGAGIALAELMSESGRAMLKEIAASTLGFKEMERRETAESAGWTREERKRRMAEGLSPREFEMVNVGQEKLTKAISNTLKSAFKKIGDNNDLLGDVTGAGEAKKAFLDALNFQISDMISGSGGFAKGISEELKRKPMFSNALSKKTSAQILDIFDPKGNASPEELMQLALSNVQSTSRGFMKSRVAVDEGERRGRAEAAVAHLQEGFTLQQAGFSGLAGRQIMQAEMNLGVDPGAGVNSIFAKDRRRLGLEDGLTTGGLGASRKFGKQKEDQVQKQKDPMESIADSSERTAQILERELN